MGCSRSESRPPVSRKQCEEKPTIRITTAAGEKGKGEKNGGERGESVKKIRKEG
jgi:hypothetical protein